MLIRTLGLVLAFSGLVASPVIIFGAIQMLRMKNYTWGFAAVVLAIVAPFLLGAPFLLDALGLSAPLLVGAIDGGFISLFVMLPVGIWAFRRLRRKEVKESFPS